MKLNNKKIKFLNKILSSGSTTEKEILQLKLEDIINKPGIKIDDLKELIELQSAIKSKNLFEYLLEKKRSEPKNEQNKSNNLSNNNPDHEGKTSYEN